MLSHDLIEFDTAVASPALSTAGAPSLRPADSTPNSAFDPFSLLEYCDAPFALRPDEFHAQILDATTPTSIYNLFRI